MERRASWWLMRCWTQPLVCIRSTWANHSQTRPDKGASLATKVYPFKTSTNPGTQTPTLHKMKARQNESWDCSLCTRKLLFVFTHSLAQDLWFSIPQRTKAKQKLLGQYTCCLPRGNVKESKAETLMFLFVSNWRERELSLNRKNNEWKRNFHTWGNHSGLKCDTNLTLIFVCSSSITDAGNQLVAQEAIRKPSTLRRPSARTGESISSRNWELQHVVRAITHLSVYWR